MLLGNLGSTDQIRAAIARVEQDAHDILEVGSVVAAEYASGHAPFQDHANVRAFVFDYLTTHATGMLDWAQRTRSVLDEWPELTDDQRAARAVTRITALAARLPPPLPPESADHHRTVAFSAPGREADKAEIDVAPVVLRAGAALGGIAPEFLGRMGRIAAASGSSSSSSSPSWASADDNESSGCARSESREHFPMRTEPATGDSGAWSRTSATRMTGQTTGGEPMRQDTPRPMRRRSWAAALGLLAPAIVVAVPAAAAGGPTAACGHAAHEK